MTGIYSLASSLLLLQKRTEVEQPIIKFEVNLRLNYRQREQRIRLVR